METIGGHHWAAIRIPDDAYVIAPNRFNITTFDFDSPMTLSDPGLQDLIDNHQLNPALDSSYNLRTICGSQTVTDTRYNNPRAWYVQQQLGGRGTHRPTDQDLPFICHADHKLTIEEIKDLMSSHFQNTPYDPYEQTTGHGPYRSIALNRNLELHILQIRNGVAPAVAGIHWLAFGPNAFNAVVPFYANVIDTPTQYRDTTTQYSTKQMYWLSHTIAAIGDQYYQLARPKVENYEQQVVADSRHLQTIADQKVNQQTTPASYLTKVNQQMADKAYQGAVDLLGDLVKIAFEHAKLQF